MRSILLYFTATCTCYGLPLLGRCGTKAHKSLLPSVTFVLQNECRVSLNTVDSVEGFVADINHGRWDQVLPVVAQLRLPRGKLEALYEQVKHFIALMRPLQDLGLCASSRGVYVQVILEMIEVREVDTARALLRTQVFARVKQEEPDRFLKMEHLCGKTYLDIRRAPTALPRSM